LSVSQKTEAGMNNFIDYLKQQQIAYAAAAV